MKGRHGGEIYSVFQGCSKLIPAGQVEDPIENFGRWRTPPFCSNCGLVLHLRTQACPSFRRLEHFNYKFKTRFVLSAFSLREYATYRLGLDHGRNFAGTLHVSIPLSADVIIRLGHRGQDFRVRDFCRRFLARAPSQGRN